MPVRMSAQGTYRFYSVERQTILLVNGEPLLRERVHNLKNYVPINNVKNYVRINNVKNYVPINNVKNYVPINNVKNYVPINNVKNYFPINPFPFEWVLRALIDFTLSNARRFYSSMGNLLDRKGLKV